MVKILQCLGALSRGGIEAFIMNVYRSIDRSKFQFDFLVTQGGDFEEEIRMLGGTIYILSARNKGVFEYYKNVKCFFKEHKGEYNVIHIHAATLSSVANLYYAKKYGIQIRIIHAHSTRVKTSKLHYITHFLNKFRISSLATDYLACSEKASKWFYRGLSVKSKVVIIYNGIITESFVYNPQKRNEVRLKLSIPSDFIVIGHIGSFIPVKNHKFVLQIFEQFSKIKPQSKLILIGTGILFNEIRQMAQKMNSKDILFLGNRSDVNEILQAIDVVLMPSFFEGMPVSLIEAQTADAMVVCSNKISPDTKITNKYFALPLDLGAKRWAEFIVNNFHPNIRNDVSNEIRSADFDIDSTVCKLVSIYSRSQSNL